VDEKLDYFFKNYPSQIFPDNVKNQISKLMERKGDILRIEEQSIHLKSRAIWLKCGDKNTKFFHEFAEGRRKVNTICDIQNKSGDILSSQTYIALEENCFFKDLYSSDTSDDILNQLKVIQ